MRLCGFGLSIWLAVSGFAPAFAGAVESLPLEKTRWKLTELNGTPLSSKDESREPHLLFQSEGRLGGYDGCNRLFGSYTLDGESIHFGRLGSTMIACAKEVRDREFVEALGKAAKWRISGSRLELRGAKDEVLARFEATPPK
ncbi:MAG TPA: META domain-containing protein [Vicinamibacteria bacterium]|jgi:heat shock protein HslJ